VGLLLLLLLLLPKLVMLLVALLVVPLVAPSAWQRAGSIPRLLPANTRRYKWKLAPRRQRGALLPCRRERVRERSYTARRAVGLARGCEQGRLLAAVQPGKGAAQRVPVCRDAWAVLTGSRRRRARVAVEWLQVVLLFWGHLQILSSL